MNLESISFQSKDQNSWIWCVHSCVSCSSFPGISFLFPLLFLFTCFLLFPVYHVLLFFLVLRLRPLVHFCFFLLRPLPPPLFFLYRLLSFVFLLLFLLLFLLVLSSPFFFVSSSCHAQSNFCRRKWFTRTLERSIACYSIFSVCGWEWKGCSTSVPAGKKLSSLCYILWWARFTLSQEIWQCGGMWGPNAVPLSVNFHLTFCR